LSENKNAFVADAPVSAAEARALFAKLTEAKAVILAVSGGPDSTSLMFLAARWRKALKRGPKLIVVTVDHGLRPESAGEARTVQRLARVLGVAHRTLRWRGRKPATGLQQAARLARYRLLAEAAEAAGARHVLTAHTLDDQAETVLFRLARGSGLSGLSGMARFAPMPEGGELMLVRPLLDLPKSRLIATLKAARIRYSDDPSNRDPRFARTRLRTLMPELAREGLVPDRLSLLARRLRRADAALDAMAEAAAALLAPPPWPARGPVVLVFEDFAKLPAEVGLRLIARAVAATGNEGPVELGKLEMLHAALAGNPATGRFRRTLAGAMVTLAGGSIIIERAPSRRASKRP
jgi:tRNA(Ile)-lysidine synthase